MKITAPAEEEIVNVIKKLKDGKATNDIPAEYIKHSMGSRDFVVEITKLYETIWITKAIPKDCEHSKLVTL